MNRDTFIREMAVLTLDSSPDELRVLLTLATRINSGRNSYGKLDAVTDKRDWDEELREEIFDGLFYSLLGLEKLKTAKSARASAETIPPPGGA